VFSLFLKQLLTSLVLVAALATVGTGLIYTFDLNTSTGKWIGYQIICGFAFIFPFQIPINVAQANAAPEDISSVTAIIFCKQAFSILLGENKLTMLPLVFQVIGGAFSVSAAQSAFVNIMIKKLATTAPDVDPLQVIATGGVYKWAPFLHFPISILIPRDIPPLFSKPLQIRQAKTNCPTHQQPHRSEPPSHPTKSTASSSHTWPGSKPASPSPSASWDSRSC